MPILAPPGGYPVFDLAAQYVNPFADSRYFSFRSLDGKILLPFTGDEFVAMPGIQGLDVPDREIVEEEIPGQDGTDLVDIKIGSRPYFLPIFCGTTSGHLPFLNNRAYLRSFFNHRGVDYRANAGTFDLVANSVMGERSLRSTYVSGLAGEWSQDSMGSWWQSMGINALSVRTYWEGERWTTPKISRPTAFSWFGQFPPVLTSSRTFGSDMTVTIPGDAASWPHIEMMGPAPSVEIHAEGLYVLIPNGLAAGETAVIDTDPRTRTALFNGLIDWTRVAPQRTFAPMLPGDNVFNLDLGAAGADAYAYVSGPSQWETPW